MASPEPINSPASYGLTCVEGIMASETDLFGQAPSGPKQPRVIGSSPVHDSTPATMDGVQAQDESFGGILAAGLEDFELLGSVVPLGS